MYRTEHTSYTPETSALCSSNVISKSSEIFGIRFANINMHEALHLIQSSTENKDTENLFFVNAHCLNIAYTDADYRAALNQSDYIFPDGSGVQLGCRVNDDKLTENLNGTDLFPHLCALLEKAQKSIYLLGAQPGVANKVIEWIERHYPNLKIAGQQHGYFTPDEEPSVIAAINNSNADVLLVAMGVPMQELWLSNNKRKLNTRLNVAVGGLFDFYSDRIPRAPLWMRKYGIEWICRLYHEPARMWKRYLVGNPLYVLRLLKLKLQHRLSSPLTNGWLTTGKNRLANWKSQIRRRLFNLERQSDHNSKRVTDVILSGYALIMLIPVFLLVALAIKLDSRGPVFFSQDRAGIRGRAFKMWKFRSMYTDAEARLSELQHQNEMAGGVTFKMKNDPRITRVGKFIRKYSIDELPQLFNVFKGEMSVVGPRPALFSELTKYELDQRERLDTVPGLTSEWVVAGRSNLSFEEQAKLDIDYVKRRSFWTDIKLILKTIPIVITGRGAC